MRVEPARLVVQADGTPYSETYGDVYHSAHGGPEQTRHVFLAGNELPGRWQRHERFVILETGFGLGLNFLATWTAWEDDPERCRRLQFLSVEKHPFSAADLARAHAAWPEFAALAARLREQWPMLVAGTHRLEFSSPGGTVVLTLVFGDALDCLPQIEAGVDAFYLDGFSPARNPELWSPPLFRALARLAAPEATLATWSVAGQVRAALGEVEFDVRKKPGFAGKRQMLVGHYRSRRPPRFAPPSARRALVIGAGLAGSTVAERLAARGWHVDVLDRNPGPGQGASGNIAGILRPQPSVDDNRLAQLTRAGFLSTRRLLLRLGDAVRWQPCGVLHLAHDAAHEALQKRAVERLEPPVEYLRFLDQEAASDLVQWPVSTGGWWFPTGGWVQPATLCSASLAAWPDNIACHFSAPVAKVERRGEEWHALDDQNCVLAQAPVLIIASGTEARRFAPLHYLPLRAARGQTTHLPAPILPPSAPVVCGQGYLTPAVDCLHALGATFQIDDPDTTVRDADHRENLTRLAHLLPGMAENPPAGLAGRVGFRPLSPDRLPMVGAIPDTPGLHVALGYGARGLVWCALMAELLASRLECEPLPLPRQLADAVAPARFRRDAA